jgi:hypothetical protein
MARFSPLRHLCRSQTEDENIVGASMFQNFHVRPVKRADGEKR